MKRQNIFNLLLGSLLFSCAFLASCNNDDSEEDPITGGSRVLTFDVSETFEESTDEANRALSEKPDTIYQEFENGMMLQTVVEQDKIVHSRATAIADGTQVLAIVLNLSANKIHRIQQLTVSNGLLTCEIPTGFNVKVVFYSYNSKTQIPSTTLAVGDDADISVSTKWNKESSKDILWAQTGTIYPSSTSLGSITFKHVCSRVRLQITCGSGVSAFMASLSTGKDSYINLLSGTIESTSSYTSTSLVNIENVMGTSKTSPYKIFIPLIREPSSILTLSSFNNDFISPVITTTIPYAFKQGYSYTLHVAVENKVIWGWSSDYYQWDAVSRFIPGSAPSVGNPSSLWRGGMDPAYNSCKNCPTDDDIQIMLGNGVYWDAAGPTWYDYNGNPYTTGIWVKKKSKWNTSLKTDHVTPKTATSTQRTSKDYVFLPASGSLSINGISSNIGIGGRYWSSMPSPETQSLPGAHSLSFYEKSACLDLYSEYDSPWIEDGQLGIYVPRSSGFSLCRFE